jgi:uncharacterized protein DUF6600
MKRIFFTLTILALVLPALPRTASADVSIDFFYNNLSGGNWIEVGDYGYCWQPDVAANDPNWRPYADGYWAYTDDGWTWVSYEDFGWATYHYGRWAKLADYGWVWVPGSDLEWGPAWVSWRTGGDYIGWAPLPPGGPGVVYEGQPIGGAVDVEFDIGPEYYNFCDVRYIGEPVLRERIVDVRQNVTFINQTVNVTNITVKNNTVYNYGPDINVVNQHSSRPVQRLHLERQENVDVASAAKSGGITKVQGNNLVVAAPRRITKPAQAVAPPQLKAKVSQPKIENGWAGINPNEQAQLKQKIKTEDRSKIPPPTGAGAAAAGQATAGGSPATGARPTSPSRAVGARGEQRLREQTQPGASAAATGSPATATERGKQRGKPGATPSVVGPTANAEGAANSPAPERGRHKGRMATPATAPTAGAEGVTAPEGRRKGFERGNVGPTPPAGAGSPSENLNETRGRHEHGGQPGVAPTAPQAGLPGAQAGPPGAQGGPAGEGRGKHRAEEVGVQPTGASPTGAARETKHEGKGKAEKGSPAPTP